MPRPEKCRRVSLPPTMKGFKPYGIAPCKMEALQMLYEEYESLRLVNYEMLSQEEAAARMNVSRPTLTRIYNKALHVITRAFVEGKAIEIEGGNYEMDSDWYRCRKCHKLIEGLHNHTRCEKCTDYDNSELIFLNQ
jgi:uncharacterized protein